MEFCQSWRAYVACLTAPAAPLDSSSRQVHRISPTAARLSDQCHFGSLWEDGEKNIVVGLVFQHNQNCVKRLFQELQSKRIFRVGGGYIVSAWVILQVAAIVFPSLELPSWSMKVVLDVLLLGFVPALLLGWHLDLRRARAEKRSSVLNKDAAGGPQSPSEHTLLGEGRAGLDAKRPPYRITNGFESERVANCSRQVKKSKTGFG
jgi:hypothetical protein